MKPEVDVRGLAKPKAREYLIRFFFGGAVALLASITSKALGDFAGGLALAFPAILPAALTLVKQHDGRQQAADDARGARFGAAGLTAFAVIVFACANEGPLVALPLAMLAWSTTAGICWWLSYGRRPEHGTSRRAKNRSPARP
jgi:hypothetical protein